MVNVGKYTSPMDPMGNKTWKSLTPPKTNEYGTPENQGIWKMIHFLFKWSGHVDFVGVIFNTFQAKLVDFWARIKKFVLAKLYKMTFYQEVGVGHTLESSGCHRGK